MQRCKEQKNRETGDGVLQTKRCVSPMEREIGASALAQWRADLLERGYAPRTINTFVSAVNSFLTWLKHWEFQLPAQPTEEDIQSELTRSEYLRLLSAARARGKARTYLMIKVFAEMDLAVQELSQLTVEALEKNQIVLLTSGKQRLTVVPSCLRAELLDYAHREKISNGPIFITRNGKEINRTAVTAYIQSLSSEAQVAP